MYARRLIAIAALILFAGCAVRHGEPVFNAGSKPPNVGGTISGTVRAEGGNAITGREVTVIDAKSGARYRTSTTTTGGYTIQVPASTYRLEVELRSGEAIVRQPKETHLNVGDLDAQEDFVLTLR